jgi:seryl-tRNA synthetase
MLDIKLIRENPELVRKNLKKRHDPEKIKLLDELIDKDEKWRKGLKELDALRRKRNEITREIAILKKTKKPGANKLISEMKALPEKIKTKENSVEKTRVRARWILMTLPNLLHESVPIGKDDTDNKVVKTWGNKPKFTFQAKNHVEIAENLGIIDLDRAAKVAGVGFYYLKDDLALLDYAIQKFAIDFLMRRGYTFIEPPLMLRRKPYEGVTDLGDFESVMYKVDGDDIFLIATSEHPMAAMYMDETHNRDNLPIKMCGLSPCFRREIGSHGKYTKGLFRVHHFNKIEQFIFCHPKDSQKYHEELQRNCEELYQALDLHYRVVNVCTGDIGSIAAKKFDTEIWMADNEFREIGSNSNCTDYQARRLNIRFREKESQPVAGFVHTLNNTALATSRTMVALLEQHQQKDGSVLIPKALQPYMNGKKKIEK